MIETGIAELLDELTPAYADRKGDWDRVVAAAQLPRSQQGGRSWTIRLVAVGAAMATVAALILAWPFGGRQGGILDRALAAIGTGPVLHVVLRGEWGGKDVELETGRATPVYGEEEVWYDTEGGRLHSITRLGGAVQTEESYRSKEPPADLAALGREYKSALESGTARVSGEGTIEGEPVAWVTIHSELLPDVEDGKNHEWAQQVAVSRRTFEPVALRETRDGLPGPGTLRRVLELKLSPAGSGNFSAPGTRSLNGAIGRQGREPITLEQARKLLDRPLIWLGRTYGDYPLGRIYQETTRIGRRRRVRLTGPMAKKVLACNSERDGGACIRALGVSPIWVGPDGVFTYKGPIVWGEAQSSVILFYGRIGDDPSTFRKDAVPLFDRPHITLTESTGTGMLLPGVGSYVPPAGSVFVGAGGRTGVLRAGDLRASIEGIGEKAVVTASRALRPMPG
jgi:hypothetical protein